MSATRIAEKLSFIVYEEDQMHMILDWFIDHRVRPVAMPTEISRYETNNRLKLHKRMIHGCKVCVQFILTKDIIYI